MTAILTVENCKMDEKVTVSNAAATVGNSTAGLLEGDELTVEQALRGLMIPSGNDAAIVLAEYMGKKIDPKTKDAEATFVKAMNERAKSSAAPVRFLKTRMVWTLMSGLAICTQPHTT